ncbi:hypothetical protein CPLU01_15615 [Colletotrichum plurivorum]|uniref:Uncharacterized protein n=1 Tax=Colletotrichum plurivorum TaxID=2175906 RepID=A0A8H6J959_9PEZI|nr:hypothetical protein CPLU01_15615 [Colletotrichum plurivorum]
MCSTYRRCRIAGPRARTGSPIGAEYPDECRSRQSETCYLLAGDHNIVSTRESGSAATTSFSAVRSATLRIVGDPGAENDPATISQSAEDRQGALMLLIIPSNHDQSRRSGPISHHGSATSSWAIPSPNAGDKPDFHVGIPPHDFCAPNHN